MKLVRCGALVAVLAVMLAAACAPGACAQDQDQPQSKAQKKAEAQLRVVHGTVIDKQENPVPSSVVYLKNLKTLAVKTYIADDTASYRFSGLDPNVDYRSCRAQRFDVAYADDFQFRHAARFGIDAEADQDEIEQVIPPEAIPAKKSLNFRVTACVTCYAGAVPRSARRRR